MRRSAAGDLRAMLQLSDARKAEDARIRERAMSNVELREVLLAQARRRGEVAINWPEYFRGIGVRSNPSTAGAVAAAFVPFLPYALLGLGAWYVYRKFMAGFGGEVAAGAAHAAGAVPEAYGQAARTALDPSQWPAAYQQAEQAWQAAGGQGSPIAGPYYGPAGPWGGRDDAAPVPAEQGGQ